MLVVFKILFLLAIFVLSMMIGVIISKKYSNRVDELQETITGLEILESRINYTYDTIPEIFDFISRHLKTNIKNIFEYSSEKLLIDKNFSAGELFSSTIDEERILLDLNDTDIDILKGLSVSLGQVDLENQVKNIRLIIRTLTSQLEIAKAEKDKNFKLCRNMGALVGVLLIIILV